MCIVIIVTPDELKKRKMTVEEFKQDCAYRLGATGDIKLIVGTEACEKKL